MQNFKKWFESNGYKKQLDTLSLITPRRIDPKDFLNLDLGEKQEDPMYQTLHKTPKKTYKPQSQSDRLFGINQATRP